MEKQQKNLIHREQSKQQRTQKLKPANAQGKKNECRQAEHLQAPEEHGCKKETCVQEQTGLAADLPEQPCSLCWDSNLVLVSRVLRDAWTLS